MDSANAVAVAVAVAAGEAHTLALTRDGRVFSWGRGMFGRLGTGSEADELSPVEVKFWISQPQRKVVKFVGVSAGAYHSLALSDDGSIWSWGYNMYGQLGFDGGNTATPCSLGQFLKSGNPDSSTDELLKVCHVKAGGMMSLAIDNIGGLWVWGNYPQQSSSAEGGFCVESSFTPTPVRDFLGRAVAKVACGNEHIVALVSAAGKGDDDLVAYSWGTNKHGQLGLGDRESKPRPEIVVAFGGDCAWAVYEVACGGFHTALLARKKGQGDVPESVTTCWTFGLGENGQLGLGTTQSLATPQQVKGLPNSARLISIDCGLFHTSVVSSAADVWSWGMERGLGLCPDARVGAESGDAISPLLIHSGEENAKFESPVQVACGAAHTVLVACSGSKLWSWGRGRSGVLGTGKTNDCLVPTPVSWPELANDVKEESEKTVDKKHEEEEDNAVKKIESEEVGQTKTDDKLEALQRRLSAMERYASVLHRSIFGKPFEEKNIPVSHGNFGNFDAAKEWENMLESADRAELVGLEMFYRSMLSGVKDRLVKRRVQEAIKECLGSLAKGNFS